MISSKSFPTLVDNRNDVSRVYLFCLFNHCPLLPTEGEHEGDGFATSSKDSKELFILRKTLAELELRIETQKRTLAARDESVRRLLEMLQVRLLVGKIKDCLLLDWTNCS